MAQTMTQEMRAEQAQSFINEMQSAKQAKIDAIASYTPEDFGGENYVITCAGLALRLDFAGNVGKVPQYKTAPAGGAQRATRFNKDEATALAARIQNGGGTVAIAVHYLEALNRDIADLDSSIALLQDIVDGKK